MREQPFEIDERGQTWRGTYVVDGGELSVASAYGSARQKLAGRPPEPAAKAMLAGLVQAWRTGQRR